MKSFIEQYLTSAVAALVIVSVVYFIFWVLLGKKLANRKIQLSKRAGWPQIKEEIVASLISFFGSTMFMMLVLSLKEKGLTKFYTATSADSIGYQALTVVVMLLASDTWFYWCHRAMHHPSIYKYVHALHHKSLDVNPYTSTSFHMIESLLLTVWVLPLAMVMPISMTALGVMQVLGTFNNLKSHLGYEFFPKFFNYAPFSMLVTATNHSLHHTQYNGNYGLFFRFWDIIFGTELNTTSQIFNEIHNRQNQTITNNSFYRKLTIQKLVKENSHTVSVYFKPTEKEFYNYLAGQYLTIKVNIQGKVHSRCFSLSSSPNIDDFLRITVKLKGEVSHYFYYDAKVGDTIDALLPVGDFNFVPDASKQNSYVLIAGGSGITPLYSMLQQILHNEPNSAVTLLYTNKNSNDIIFKNELDTLATRFPQFKYVDFISGNKRIDIDTLKAYIDATFYICGPDGLKTTINKQLQSLNVNKERINVEHFADGYLPWFGLFKKKLPAA
jgi:ring-1,2-phenylacetyl-CoA epoxidase subunit PaaE